MLVVIPNSTASKPITIIPVPYDMYLYNEILDFYYLTALMSQMYSKRHTSDTTGREKVVYWNLSKIQTPEPTSLVSFRGKSIIYPR